jgi:hypothetical protein
LQLLGGELFLPIETLRVIEDKSLLEKDLQLNLEKADECGNISTIKTLKKGPEL